MQAMQIWSITLHGPAGVISAVDTAESQFVIGTESAADVYTVNGEGVMPRHAWVWIGKKEIPAGWAGICSLLPYKCRRVQPPPSSPSAVRHVTRFKRIRTSEAHRAVLCRAVPCRVRPRVGPWPPGSCASIPSQYCGLWSQSLKSGIGLSCIYFPAAAAVAAAWCPACSLSAGRPAGVQFQLSTRWHKGHATSPWPGARRRHPVRARPDPPTHRPTDPAPRGLQRHGLALHGGAAAGVAAPTASCNCCCCRCYCC
jgi:hypothetical protein